MDIVYAVVQLNETMEKILHTLNSIAETLKGIEKELEGG